MSSPSPSIPELVDATESTPLFSTNGPIRADTDTSKSDDASTRTMFFQELLTIPRYALPICSAQLLEYSIVLVPVISLGHLSTTYLAAVSLGSMTANVTGYSILLGLTSGLDTVLPSAWTSSEPRRYFQSQGHFYIQTRIICIAAPLNILANYLLVWGPASIRLGFIGAPIASALTTSLISLTSLIHGAYLIPQTAWYPLTMHMFTNLGVLVRLGLAGIGQLASEWWAWELVALAASFFGPTALAAQSILISTSATVFQLGYAIANATSIRSLVKTPSDTYFSAVVELVSGVLPLIALYQIVDGNSIVAAGILRARGQQFIGAILNITAYYVIGMPVAYWLAFERHLGLGGLWVGYIVALTYCAVIGTVLCFMTDWEEEVLKVERRLAEERLQQANYDA
ncbi:hypothetical protein C0989_008291 [Termitomyces sp. Mn162]|nr:hypothetical protein C0989_008291 [Termitomyces sp. Mn162]